MTWESFKTKTVQRSKNVETFSVVRDSRANDMGFPDLRGNSSRLSWNDRPVFRLAVLGMIVAVWSTLIFVIGFN